MNDNLIAIVVGNCAGAKTQSRTVYSIDGLSPTICAVHGDALPYIVVSK